MDAKDFEITKEIPRKMTENEHNEAKTDLGGWKELQKTSELLKGFKEKRQKMNLVAK